MPKAILIVDDSNAIRQSITFVLEQAGYRVVQAVDGLDATGKLGEAFDLVVSDVNMPNMDGISLVRALRGLPEYKFTPLLMLTTESGPEKKQEGKAAGATGWLVKPFNPEQLLNTVKRVLA